MIYKYSSFDLVLKDIDEPKGIISGYFASFNTVDRSRDMFVKGAFAKSIQERGPKSTQPRIKHFLNHSPWQPLGLLKELGEDNIGLAYVSQLGTHTLAKDFIEMVKSGLVTEHSVGFEPIVEEKNDEGIYIIREGRLWEGSCLTGWGMNANTPVTSMKSEDSISALTEQMKRMEDFCRKSTASDETIELVLIHLKQLTQRIIDLTEKGTQAEKSLEPLDKEDKADEGLALYLQTINSKMSWNLSKQ